MAKSYKNVYTIFEKAKRGELGTKSDQPSLFSNIRYNIRNEVVKPYLHYIDESALQKSVRKHVLDSKNYRELVQIAASKNKKLKSPDDLFKQVNDIYSKFPKEIINDVFNMYNKSIQDMDFEKRSDKNKFRFKMLEKANNPITKVMTQSSHLKSMVFSRNFIQSYIMQLAMLEQEDKAAFDEIMKQLSQKGGDGDDQKDGKGQPQQGSGEGAPDSDDNAETTDTSDTGQNPGQGGSSKGQNNTNTPEQILEKMMNSAAGKEIHEKAMEQAKQTAQMIDNIMSEDQQDKAWEDIGDKYDKNSEAAMHKTDIKFLEKIEAELQKVSFSMSSVKNKIKTLLDKSVSYFSSRETPVYESIFDADSMDGVMDFELLHPALRKCCIEDVMVKESKKIGKIDIYCDMSGSMSSGCGSRDKNGNRISKSTFAKAFAYKMKELNMLNNVYSFQTSVKFEGTELYNILAMSDGGSTNIDSVIRSIEKNGRNAIIITDAEDHCQTYSDKAYFIGVEGAQFDYFEPRILNQYYQGNQMCVFDGKSVFNINESGRVIN